MIALKDPPYFSIMINFLTLLRYFTVYYTSISILNNTSPFFSATISRFYSRLQNEGYSTKRETHANLCITACFNSSWRSYSSFLEGFDVMQNLKVMRNQFAYRSKYSRVGERWNLTRSVHFSSYELLSKPMSKHMMSLTLLGLPTEIIATCSTIKTATYTSDIIMKIVLQFVLQLHQI